MSSASGVRQCKGKLRAALVLLAACATIACEGAEHDILVDNTILAEGEFFKLAWGGTQVERFHVLAHRGTTDGDVVVVSPQQAEPCSLGPLDGYMALQPANSGKYVLGSPSPARIGLFDELDADGRGRLGFAGLDCKRTPLELHGIDPDDVRRLHPKDLTQLNLVVPKSDGSLLLLNPWTEKQRTIAKDVHSVRTSSEGMWLIEGGRAVRRDLDGIELARYGSGVTELLPLGDDDELALVDERGLVLRKAGKEKEIDSQACRVRTLGGFIPRALGYFSPCDSRKLVLRTVDGKEHHYEPSIGSLFAQDGRLLFTVEQPELTELWLVTSDELDEPVLIAELEDADLQSVWRMSRTTFRLAVRKGDGTLALLLVDAADESREVKTLLSGLSVMSTYEDGMAVLDAKGTLSLLRRDTLAVLMRAKGVPRSGFRFVFGGEATALAYIHEADADGGLGDLSLQFLTGEHFEIARNAREFREVWWPESGLLYATGGARAAMRFARVDVPCEKTSDSPWACGF